MGLTEELFEVAPSYELLNLILEFVTFLNIANIILMEIIVL